MTNMTKIHRFHKLLAQLAVTISRNIVQNIMHLLCRCWCFIANHFRRVEHWSEWVLVAVWLYDRPAHCAALTGSVEMLEALRSERGNLWVASHVTGNYPLHEAAIAQHLGIHLHSLSFRLDRQSSGYSIRTMSALVSALPTVVTYARPLLHAVHFR